MATSAKRYGLEAEDPELELRLRRIEAELERRSGSDDEAFSDSTQRVTNIPQVSGLRVKGSTPGSVTVEWNQVRVSDLRRYELDLAEDFAFNTNKQTFNLASTEYQISTVSISGGSGNIAIYVRVRAKNRAGNTGNYSAVLNTLTGQVQTSDIDDGAVTDPKMDESAVIQLALRGYIAGLQLSPNTSAPTTTIDVSVGVSRDTTNTMTIDSNSVISKLITSAWAAGTGNGGYGGASALAADKPYFVFVVSDANTSTIDVGFDDNPAGTNLLALTSGLTYFRRLGCVVTDGSLLIRAFHQYGDLFQYDSPVQDPASLSTAGSVLKDVVQTHTLSLVPVGITCRVQMTIAMRPSSFLAQYSAQTAYSSGYDSGLIASLTNLDGGTVASRVNEWSADILLPVDATIKTYTTDTSDSNRMYFQIHSWVDTRGKDGIV